MDIEKLEKQIDELNDKTQALLESAYRAEDPTLAIDHLMESDRQLYKFLANRAIGYASTRRVIVDDIIKAFRTMSIAIRDVSHGLMGPGTRDWFLKVSSLPEADIAEYKNLFLSCCKYEYKKLADSNPDKFGRFLKGWYNRVDSLI